MGGPARQAADELVRQGQKLMDDGRQLDLQKAAPIGGRRQFIADQARYAATYMTYALGIDLTPTPTWVQVALKSMEAWDQRQDAIDHRLDPAQARLQSVRTDLTDSLDGASPLGQRDTRAINASRDRRDGPGR